MPVLGESGGSGDSGGSSGIALFKDPMEMPAFAITLAPGIYDQSSRRTQSNSLFWDCLNGDGAYISGSTSADTYVTVIDVSGKGYLGNVILYQTQTNANDATYTVKFTVDGTEYIRQIMYDAPANNYLFLGADHHMGLSTDTTYIDDHYSMSRLSTASYDQSTDGSVCKINNNLFTFHSPFKYIAMGIPVLAFETDLKVEVKSSIGRVTTGYDQYVGVTMNYVVEGS